MATAKLKRKPRLSKIESYKAANIKEKFSFASSFVSLLMGTYPAAAARRTGRTCRLHWVLGCSFVNAKALGPQEGS
jgi:hypothetical protein